ncbi:MAG: molybdenum cofactor biosynthesis protein MoaE [Thermoanaerobaculia bacterium]|nr:molybdenum cofactor biosynthesis protein MoaE [Thermoanaerobaculia bacterium]
MKITVVAFASASEALGSSETSVELPADSTLDDLRQRLTKLYPGLADLWPRLAIAVDGVLSNRNPALADGNEVALLPPVSGGESPARVRVDGAPIDAAELQQIVAATGCGAVVLFLGTVRDHHQGRQVKALSYTAYRRMAESVLETIVAELEAQEPATRIAIHHRVGNLLPGESSVGIAVAAPHRQPAFELSRLALERLKREVPVWKMEHYSDGEARWREEEPLNPQVIISAGSTSS